MKKRIPRFSTEDEEREFWGREDSSDYVDWRKGRRVVPPNLKPSLKTISLRLPEHLLAKLKLLANKRDVPYQSLLKIFLAERVRQELHGTQSNGPTSNSSLQRSSRSGSGR